MYSTAHCDEVVVVVSELVTDDPRLLESETRKYYMCGPGKKDIDEIVQTVRDALENKRANDVTALYVGVGPPEHRYGNGGDS